MKDEGCVDRGTFIPGSLQEPSYNSEGLGDKGLIGDVGRGFSAGVFGFLWWGAEGGMSG